MHCLSKTSPSFRTIPGIIDGERSREATADVAERERRSFKMKPIPRIATHAQAEKTTRRPSKVVLKKIILVCYAQAGKATRRPSEVVLKKIILGTLKKLAFAAHRPNFIGKACNSGTIHGNYFFLLYQRVQIFFRAINHHKVIFHRLQNYSYNNCGISLLNNNSNTHESTTPIVSTIIIRVFVSGFVCRTLSGHTFLRYLCPPRFPLQPWS